MKQKGLIMLLASILAVAVMSITVFAAEATVDAAKTASDGSEATNEFQLPESKCGRHGKGKTRQRIEEPENAVGKDAAKAAALADAGLTDGQVEKIHAKVSQTEDGTVIYRVRFTYNDQNYVYQIDAVTGEILEKDDNAPAKSGKGGMRKADDSEGSLESSRGSSRKSRKGFIESSDVSGTVEA